MISEEMGRVEKRGKLKMTINFLIRSKKKILFHQNMNNVRDHRLRIQSSQIEEKTVFLLASDYSTNSKY